MLENIATWYTKRLWTASMVAQAVAKGILTADQYTGITGKVLPETPPEEVPEDEQIK